MIDPRKHLKEVYRSSNVEPSRLFKNRLDRNERNQPFSPKFVARIREKINDEMFMTYPEPKPIYDKMARWLGVNGGKIMLHLGSEQSIKSVFETYIDPGVASSLGQYYYMVVPVNETGFIGASTYSIGIWTEEYLSGYDTFGIPLKQSFIETADWYCDKIPDSVGINYYIRNEQRWGWHSTRMPAGAYDPILEMTEGYQISTWGITKFTFIGQ